MTYYIYIMVHYYIYINWTVVLKHHYQLLKNVLTFMLLAHNYNKFYATCRMLENMHYRINSLQWELHLNTQVLYNFVKSLFFKLAKCSYLQ